jgi:acyl-CoA synthetase (AMP-forming)/AMP-acid ligase II
LNLLSSSLEVEDALYRHPAVIAAAVVAQPDSRWGETPCAFVELKPGASATEAELIAHCQGLLVRFKAPKKSGLRRFAEDLQRQDPEVPVARAGEVDGRD